MFPKTGWNSNNKNISPIKLTMMNTTIVRGRKRGEEKSKKTVSRRSKNEESKACCLIQSQRIVME